MPGRGCRVNVGSNPGTPRLPLNSELPIPGRPRYTPAIVPRTLPAATPRLPAPLVGVLVVLLLVTVLACPQSTAAPGLPASATAIDARGSDPPPAFPTLHRTTHSSVSAFQPFSFSSDLSHTRGGAGVIGGLLAIVEEDGRTLLPVHDGHGNITAVVNAANGHTVARYDYGPFGELIGQSGDVGASPFRYQSKYLDPEKCDRIRSILDGGGAGARRVRHAMPRMSNQTGLHYFGHRYYAGHRGRWISRDPLGEVGGWNLYAYCEKRRGIGGVLDGPAGPPEGRGLQAGRPSQNDPAGRIDLNGLSSWRLVAGSVQVGVTPEGRIIGTVRIRNTVPACGGASLYPGSLAEEVHYEEKTIEVTKGMQLEARLFGGGYLGMTLDDLQVQAEQIVLERAEHLLENDRLDQFSQSVEIMGAVASIAPGWESGEAISEGRYGAAAGYAVRDLVTFWVGGTAVRGATRGQRAWATASLGAASGLTYTTGTIATERLEAAFTGQDYDGTWGGDAIQIGLGMAFGGAGGYAVGRWFGGGGAKSGRLTMQWRDIAGEWRGWRQGFADTGRFRWGGRNGLRVRHGQSPSVQPYDALHHRILAQGGTRHGAGRLTLRGFFGEQYGRYIPNFIKNSRWNLRNMGQPMHRGGSGLHEALHGTNPDMPLGIMKRVWYGTNVWDKIAIGGAGLGIGFGASYYFDR